MASSLSVTNTHLSTHLLTTDEHFSSVFTSIQCLSADWKKIGINLEIPYSRIKAIESNRERVDEKLMDLVEAWLSRESEKQPKPTWKKLYEAVSTVDRTTAEAIAEEHQCDCCCLELITKPKLSYEEQQILTLPLLNSSQSVSQAYSDRIEQERQALEKFKQMRIHQGQPKPNREFDQNVDELRIRNKTFESEKSELMRENAYLRRETSRIQSSQEENIRLLNDKVAILSVQNESLRTDNSRIQSLQEENIRLLKDEVEILSVQNDSLRTDNSRLMRDISSSRRDSGTNNAALIDIKYWSVNHTNVRRTGQKLGDGGWGVVEVGILYGQKVALKTLHSDIISPHYNDLIKREVAMMAKVRHPNLLLFIAAVFDHPSGSPVIITELMDTSLRKSYGNRQLDYKMKLCILRDVASALNYLHSHNDRIIHRDVSSANVLLESRGLNKWRAKVSDFGSANIARLSKTAAPGAELYTAPEVPGNQTPKMDVYSYGIMACELLTNEFPLCEEFPRMLGTLFDQWPLMHQLVLDCTKTLPRQRHDMSDVLRTLYENYNDILTS